MCTYYDYDRNLLQAGERVSQSESEMQVICDPSISRSTRRWGCRGEGRRLRAQTSRAHTSFVVHFAVIFFSLSSTYPARRFFTNATSFRSFSIQLSSPVPVFLSCPPPLRITVFSRLFDQPRALFSSNNNGNQNFRSILLFSFLARVARQEFFFLRSNDSNNFQRQIKNIEG